MFACALAWVIPRFQRCLWEERGALLNGVGCLFGSLSLIWPLLIRCLGCMHRLSDNLPTAGPFIGIMQIGLPVDAKAWAVDMMPEPWYIYIYVYKLLSVLSRTRRVGS